MTPPNTPPMADPTLPQLLSQERDRPLGWYYIFFCNRVGAVTSGTVVWARGLGGALTIAAEHGLTPGGGRGPALEDGTRAHGRSLPDSAVVKELCYRNAPIEQIARLAPHLLPAGIRQ